VPGILVNVTFCQLLKKSQFSRDFPFKVHSHLHPQICSLPLAGKSGFEETASWLKDPALRKCEQAALEQTFASSLHLRAKNALKSKLENMIYLSSQKINLTVNNNLF